MAKKITFCTYDAPLFHGPNTWLKRLLPDLRENGFTISVLIFFEHDLTKCETYKYFLEAGLIVKTFPFQTIAEEKIRWILKTLSADPPDIFVPHMLVHAFFAAKWVKEAGIPTIGLIHSDDSFYQGIQDEFVSGKEEFRLTTVVACSQYLFNKVNERRATQTIVRCIPYGVPLTNLPTTNFDGQLKLIYIGRLVEKQKRIKDVVKAICAASNSIPGVEGVIYGHGDVNNVLNLIAKYSKNDKVKFYGSVSNENIFKALSSAQVFVLLSEYEGLPQALLEAMACGLIPVCTHIKSGIPQLITNYETGILLKDRDASFLKAIQTLKNDPSICRTISTNAKEIVKNYSTDVCTKSWITLLDELLLKSQPGQIEIPATIDLPKRHPYLKLEDFRIPKKTDIIINRIRNTGLFHFLKKLTTR